MRAIRLTALLPLLFILAAVPLMAAQEKGGPPVRESYLLQVVLLLGKTEGSSDTSNIPENTIQTLKDVENFLPYKSYQLLDTSLIRSDGHARSLLHGPSGREFHLSLDFRTEKGENGKRLAFQAFRISAPPEPPAPPRPPEPPAPPSAPEPSPAPAPRASGPVLSSSFTIDVGETIVVGTSKLNGGSEALLVLLTVVP